MQKQTAEEPGPQHLISHAEDPKAQRKREGMVGHLGHSIQTLRVATMGTPHRCMGDLGTCIWLCRNRGSIKNSTAMVLTHSPEAQKWEGRKREEGLRSCRAARITA